MAPAGRAELDDTARAVAGVLLERVPELTDRLVERLTASDPGYRRLAPEALADVRKSCEDNVVSVLRDLAGRRPARTAAARETARRRAEQGVPLASLLGAYRTGMRVLWEAMDQEVAASGTASPATMVGLATTMWDLFDAYSGSAATAYDEALVDLARRDERQRTLLLDDLLEGRDPGAELRASVARALDLPEEGPYVAVAAEVPAPGAEGLPRADQALRREGIRSAWRLRAADQVGIVALGPGGLAAVRTALAGLAVTRAGISPPYDQLGGTARAVAQAALARRTVPAGMAAVVTLDDHPLGNLVAGAPEMAARLAATVLGPVLALPGDERGLLLETLAGWVAAGGSASEAARRLYCHRNTVRNRLARLEELTGRQLARPDHLTELWAAAEAVRLGSGGEGK